MELQKGMRIAIGAGSKAAGPIALAIAGGSGATPSIALAIAAALGAASGAGLAVGTGCLLALRSAGWPQEAADLAFKTIPFAGAISLLAGLLAGIIAWALGRRLARGSGPLLPAAVLAPGLLGFMVPFATVFLFNSTSVPSFSRLGALRIGETWVELSPAAYLSVCSLGPALMGIAVLLAAAAFLRGRKSSPWPALFIAVCAAGLWRIAVFPPTGDEPYILLSTRTVVADATLDLDPALSRGEGSAIHPDFPLEDFRSHHAVPIRGGGHMSRHGILLPLLYAPGYAVAGRAGLALLLALAMVLLLIRLERVLVLLGNGPEAARSTVALLAAASPLPVFTVFLSPDLPGALVVTLGLLAILEGRWVALAACSAVLPWIHHKISLMALGLVLATAVRHGPRKAAIPLAALAASGAALWMALAAFTDVPAWPPWSVFTFAAGQYDEHFSAANIPSGVLGTLFDRHQGMVWFPALFLALAGPFTGKARGQGTRLALALAAPYLALLLTFNVWGGAPGAPGRMLVLLLPCAAVLMAPVVGSLGRTPAGRGALAALAVAGCLLLWVFAAVPATAFVSARLKLEAAVSARLGFDPLMVLPSVPYGTLDARTLVHGLALAAVLAVGLAVTALAVRSLARTRR